MTKEKKLRVVALCILCLPFIPLMYGMLGSWKKPVIFDGDYSFLGAIYVSVWVICYVCGAFLYRVGGIPHFKFIYLSHRRLRQHKKFLFKFIFSFIACTALLYFTAKAITYPTIESKEDNNPTDIIFLITYVERESYTQTLNRVEGFSYLHNEEIRFPWNKNQIDRGWIYTCVMLKTDGNQWGKMIRSIEKVSRNRCPKVNNE